MNDSGVPVENNSNEIPFKYVSVSSANNNGLK